MGASVAGARRGCSRPQLKGIPLAESGGRVFVIADLHFGHVKVAGVRGFASTQEHDDALVAAWNATVTKRDVVYVLGDVFQVDRVAELKGTKKLALGNHDQRPVATYDKLFSKVRACFEFDGCLLTHIPVNPNQFHRFELNVHGHMHTHALEDRRFICVSAEQCQEWRPQLLRDLLKERRAALKAEPC